jgi:hypothetical protein
MSDQPENRLRSGAFPGVSLERCNRESARPLPQRSPHAGIPEDETLGGSPATVHSVADWD